MYFLGQSFLFNSRLAPLKLDVFFVKVNLEQSKASKCVVEKDRFQCARLTVQVSKVL